MREDYDYEDVIGEIRASGVFSYLPRGMVTDELCLAAATRLSRRKILELFFDSRSPYVVDHAKGGNRRLCLTDCVHDVIAKQGSASASITKRVGRGAKKKPDFRQK